LEPALLSPLWTALGKAETGNVLRDAAEQSGDQQERSKASTALGQPPLVGALDHFQPCERVQPADKLIVGFHEGFS
jgi:hypothetical protein